MRLRSPTPTFLLDPRALRRPRRSGRHRAARRRAAPPARRSRSRSMASSRFCICERRSEATTRTRGPSRSTSRARWRGPERRRRLDVEAAAPPGCSTVFGVLSAGTARRAEPPLELVGGDHAGAGDAQRGRTRREPRRSRLADFGDSKYLLDKYPDQSILNRVAKAGRANPLALAVLACLNERPMHPYEVAQTLRSRAKHESIRLNYGSLYGVVEQLEKRGFIAGAETVREGRRPERTIYEIIRHRDARVAPTGSPSSSRCLPRSTCSSRPRCRSCRSCPPDDAVEILKERSRGARGAPGRDARRRARGQGGGSPRLFELENEYVEALLRRRARVRAAAGEGHRIGRARRHRAVARVSPATATSRWEPPERPQDQP